MFIVCIRGFKHAARGPLVARDVLREVSSD